MTIEQHIEELRAELNACIDQQERDQIAEELAVAQAECGEIVAQLECKSLDMI